MGDRYFFTDTDTASLVHTDTVSFFFINTDANTNYDTWTYAGIGRYWLKNTDTDTRTVKKIPMPILYRYQYPKKYRHRSPISTILSEMVPSSSLQLLIGLDVCLNQVPDLLTVHRKTPSQTQLNHDCQGHLCVFRHAFLRAAVLSSVPLL